MSSGDEEETIARAIPGIWNISLFHHSSTTYGTLSTVQAGNQQATAECKQPGNLYEAVKRGWEIIHFRTETFISEPG